MLHSRDMSGTTTVAGRLGLLALVVLFQTLPNLVLAASPLRLECAQEPQLPGRALVCEYSILGHLNAQLADLHDRIIREGRATRVDVRRWLSQRDACRDVDCLDSLFDAGIRAARIALVDIETRQPTPILVNARGVPVRLRPEEPRAPASIGLKTAALETVAFEGERHLSARARAPAIQERSRFEVPFDVLLLLIVAAAVLYTIVVVRISRPV